MAEIIKPSRNAHPECFRYMLTVLRSSATTDDKRLDSCSFEQLVTALIDAGYPEVTAKETVQLALSDGLLMPGLPSGTSVSSPRPRSAVPELKRVRLPNSQEVRINSSHDWYCYECHLPGVLQECTHCWRSFHRSCYRKNPERPNYSVPSSKKQKNRLPAFSSDTGSDTEDVTARCSTTIDSEGAEPEIRTKSSLLQTHDDHDDNDSIVIDNGITQAEPKPKLADLDSKTKVEVVCMGEVRPPNRVRPNTTASNISCKSEIATNDEEDQDLCNMCTCCRLLKRANLHNPPNLQADELSHLVTFTFSRNREWLTEDVGSYLESQRINAKEISLVNHLLLYSPVKRLNNIDVKLDRHEYNLLTEFYVDLLDIQHNVGIFFGPYSTELESTKWLLRDVAHDLSEIRRCSDCFRYSHEKDSIIWFAKPCVQRHELVYAKHSSFPYWPAKVVRVLPNNKFDVRFFGGNHSRALIDVKYIKPIDSDIKSLKLGNGPGIKKAMDELRYHQMLSTYPPSTFSFHANPQDTQAIINTVLSSNPTTAMMKDSRRSGAAKRKKSAVYSHVEEVAAKNTSEELATGTFEKRPRNDIVCPELRVSVKRLKSHPALQQHNQINIVQHNEKRSTRKSNKKLNADDATEVLDTMIKELEEARKTMHDYKQKYEKTETQKQKLKETIKKHELEVKIIKRKQWCYWCLEEAIYLCCFRAAYCSEKCQARHWDSHSKFCKNPTNGTNPKA